MDTNKMHQEKKNVESMEEKKAVEGTSKLIGLVISGTGLKQQNPKKMETL